MSTNRTAQALVQPIDTTVFPPKTNPLDGSMLLQKANHNSLSTDSMTEDLTTPEASLSHTELEPFDDDPTFIPDIENESPSQSTLSGGTFHTTQLEAGDYADSDESQQWQITQTARGTGTLEH